MRLRCEHDEDNNGLDDEMERLVADCVAPMVVFKLGSYQPPQATAFSAVQTSPTTFKFKYGYFWPSDDGHTEENCVFGAGTLTSCTEICAPGCAPFLGTLFGYGLCMSACEYSCALDAQATCTTACHILNAHDGDAQGMAVEVEVTPTTYYYEAKFRAFLSGTETEREYSGAYPFGTTHDDPRVPATDGDRAVIYASPGKHHFYAWSGTSEYSTITDPYDLLPRYPCYDPHDGSATWIPSGLLHFPPSNSLNDVIGCSATSCGPTAKFVNQCARDRNAAPGVVAVGLDSPTALDCPYFEDTYCGGGGDVARAANVMSLPAATDTERDPCQRPKALGAADADHDGITDSCDRDPYHRNVYVGRGGVRSDGVFVSGTSAFGTPTKPYAGNATLRGGWSDFDADNVADGSDLCPNEPALVADVNNDPEWLATDWNRWAHKLNFSEFTGNPDVITQIEARTGYFHRGNVCDPYPVTKTRASERAGAFGPPGQTLFCKGLTAIASGATALPIEAKFTVGASANSVSVPYKTFKHQSYRCDCEGVADCLDRPANDCFRGKMRPDLNKENWRGWRAVPTPGCATDTMGYCLPDSRTLQVGDERTELPTWNWVEETTNQPTHFRPGSVHPQSGVFTIGVLGSDDKFAIRTAFDDGAGLAKVPGSGLVWDPQYSLYSEPDVGPEAVQVGIDQVSSEKNRRLRSSVSEKLVQPIAEHDAFIDTGECFPPLDLGSWLPFVTGYRDPIDEGWFEFIARPGGLTRLQVRRTAENRLRSVAVGPSVPSWVQGAGAAGALPARRGGVAVVGEDSTQLGGRPEPTLMWIETATIASTRWALLSPSATTATSVTYALSAEGETSFGLSRAAVVVTDPVNDRISLVDPIAGVVALYDPMLRRWTPHTVPAVRRVGASFVLDGSALMVAGGELDGTLATDLLVVDVITGASSARPGFPARRDALLGLTRDDHALAFAGGVDASGKVHDDIWTLAYRSPTAVSTKLSGDTLLGGGIRAGNAMLDVGVRAHDLQAVILSSDGYPERRQRVAGGWRALDVGLPQPSCSATDATGGELCSLTGSTLWSTPGRRTCANSAPAHACQGALGDVVTTRKLGTGAVAVGASNNAAWTLRRRSVEQRRLNERLEDVSVTNVALASPARAMAVTDEGAVIATDDGFAFVAADATTAGVTSVETCGRPVAVENVSPGVWVGLTTLGVALLSTSDGVLTVKYVGLLVRPERQDGHGHDDEGDEEPALTTPAPESERTRQCGVARRRLGDTGCNALGDASALVPIGSDEMLVRRGAYYARVRAGAQAFTSTAWVKSETKVEAVRHDALGGRAYGSMKNGALVFDLRGGGVTAHKSTVQLDAWIQRKDAGALSVLLEKEKVTVARVVR